MAGLDRGPSGNATAEHWLRALAQPRRSRRLRPVPRGLPSIVLAVGPARMPLRRQVPRLIRSCRATTARGHLRLRRSRAGAWATLSRCVGGLRMEILSRRRLLYVQDRYFDSVHSHSLWQLSVRWFRRNIGNAYELGPNLCLGPGGPDGPTVELFPVELCRFPHRGTAPASIRPESRTHDVSEDPSPSRWS